MKYFSEYVDELQDKTCVIPQDSALMFCYFNNNEYFHKYLDQFDGKFIFLNESSYLISKNTSGKIVILIGPIDGARHCDPEPDYLQEQLGWELQNSLSLEEEDKISIYRRMQR